MKRAANHALAALFCAAAIAGCASGTPNAPESERPRARADARDAGAQRPAAPGSAPPIPATPHAPIASTEPSSVASRSPTPVVRRGQWSTDDRLLSGERLEDAQTVNATPERSQVSAPDRARDAYAGVFSVQLEDDPSQWTRAWLVYELSGSSHWTAVRRKINDGVEQGGFHPSRVSSGGTQVEEISPAWLVRGRNTVRFEPRDSTDPTGFTVASVRIVGKRGPSSHAEPLAAPIEAHGTAFARWTDGEPSTAVTGTEANALEREGVWSWRERARVRALEVLTRGTGSARLDLSWTSEDGRTRMRRTVDVPANHTAGTADRIELSPPIDASDLRVTVARGSEHSPLAIAELSLDASSTSTTPSRLVVSFPAHGECVEREAYVRGFALSADRQPAAELLLDGQTAMAQGNADGSFGLLLPLPSAQASSEHVIEARFADGSLTRQRFVLGRCAAISAPVADAPRDDVGAPFSGWARANSATTLTLGDAVLEIPAGAVARDTRITLRPMAATDVPALDRGMVNTSPDGRAFRFGPDGLRFAKPIRLTLPFSRARLTPGNTEADIKTFFYDPPARRWREVTRISTGASDRIAAATNHFTDYITATITAPDSPQATAFDANTIQGLQAANPAAGVQMIAPPTPNSSGTANLSFPIVVPPGRQGMQPSLALNYDSSRGNGWLGVGWDLSVSRVEVDTRNGVPEYSATSEETYLLDGAQLVAVDPPAANPRRYARRIEGAFDLIYRHGASKSDYWWDVRTRDGERHIYGRRNSAAAGDGTWDHGRLSESVGSPIGRWMLEETRDEFNNAVVYHYTVRRDSLAPPGMPGPNAVEQTLKSVEYTVTYPSFDSPVPSLQSNYFVRFETNYVRRDVHSSARLGFLVRTTGLLASIEVAQVPAPSRIRRYSLVYAPGEFGKTILQSVSVAGVEGSSDLYSHTFEYTRAPRFGGRLGFSSPKLYSHTPSTRTSGSSTSLGGNVHLGIGDVFHIINVGGGGGATYSSTTGEVERLDVTGDGVPDLLGPGLVRQNVSGSTATRFSGESVSVGHQVFGAAESRGGQLNIGLNLFDMGAGGIDGAWSWNNTHRMLTDANGDGFVDLVTGPHRLDIGGISTQVLNVFENPTPHGRTTFGASTGSGVQPDYTIGGIVVQPPSVEVTDAQLAAAISQQNVLTAPLVMWRVLERGSVRITGAIDHPDTSGDGVIAEIYRIGGSPGSDTATAPIWSHPISATDPPCIPAPGGACGAGLDVLDLRRDDRLYFVVRPGAAGSPATAQGDLVNWSPRITYIAVGPSDLCTDENRGCPWERTSIPIVVGSYFDRGEDFRVADRDISGWTSMRQGMLSIDSAAIVLPSGVSATARIWVRRAIDTTTNLPAQPTAFPIADAGIADGGPDAAGALLSPADIDSQLHRLSIQLIPVTSEVSIPSGGGTGPSVSGFQTYVGDQFFFSIQLPDDKVDPAQVRWEPRVHYTEWCGPTASGSIACSALEHCGELESVGADGESPGCLWTNPTPLRPGNQDWIPLSAVQQARPLLAVSTSGGPSAQVAYPWLDLFPITTRRVLLSTGWYRGWSAGEWRADVAGLIERNLIEPIWTAGAPTSPTPGQLSAAPTATQLTPIFVAMAAQRLPVDSSDQSAAVRAMYGVPPAWSIALGSAEEAQWVGSGRSSAVNRWSMIPSRRGGYRVESAGPGVFRITPDGDWTMSASEGAALRASNGPSGGLNITLIGIGQGDSWGRSNTTLDFFDINGDRLPDSVQNGVVRLQQRRLPGATHSTLSADRSMPGMFDAVRRSDDHLTRSGFSFGSAAGGVRKALKRAGVLTGGINNALGYAGYMPSFGRSSGRSAEVIDWLDVNGDGLPDHVQADGDEVRVRFNLGYSFTPDVPIDFFGGVGKDDAEESAFDALAVTTSRSTNVEFGFLGSGGGASWNFSYGQSRFIDINNDGLPDRVWVPSSRSGKLRVRFNLGTHFGPAVDWNAPAWPSEFAVPEEEDALTFSWGSGLKATAGAVIEVPILPFWDFSIVPSVGGGFTLQHQSGRISLEDINGDGLVDQVFAPARNPAEPVPASDRLYARMNETGGANLLSGVSGPFGARMDFEYERVGNRVETVGGERIDMPQSRYVLARIRVPGNSEGTPEGPNPEYVTTVSYEGGFYDRAEREDYGFSTVTVCNAHNTCTETRYNNQSYLLRGTVAGSFLRDNGGHRISGSEVVYETTATGMPAGVTHVRPRIERRFVYDPSVLNPTAAAITTEVERTYDGLGRLASIIDRGELTTTDDDVRVGILSYFTVPSANYNIVRPEVVVVKDYTGETLRRREATFGAVGQLLTVTDRLTGGVNPDGTLVPTPATYVNAPITTSYTYDGYGNVETVTDPSGLVLTFTYDAIATHRETITDNFGLTSTMETDLRFGAVKHTTDSNNQHVYIQFDDFGRTTAVFGPNDPTSGTPTLSYEYMLQPGVSGFPRAWAITHHKDLGRTTTIDTVTFIDRTMRVIQTKKTAERDSGTGTSTTVGWVVSGPVEYDDLGRVWRQYRGGFDATASPSHFVELVRSHLADPHTRTDYDAFDRARVVRAPDGTQVSTDYFVEPVPGEAVQRLHTRTVDPLGHERHSYARGDGSIVEVRENNTIGGTSTLLRTRYSYDVLGRLTQVLDANNNPTTATYDSLGRMISLNNRDSGLIEYRYTLQGDLGAKVTPNLRAASPTHQIRYQHDKHRLTRVQYPDGRTVELFYGSAGTWGNGAGRLQSRVDDSGSTWFAYGPLGETTATYRYLRPVGAATGGTWVQTYWSYDSFGRQRSVTYNDWETVDYHYDRGGNLQRVTGTPSGGSSRDYLAFVGYDQYGQRSRVVMGNGTETRYARDPLMQRLREVNTNGPGATALQRLRYEYNAAGNVIERNQKLGGLMGGVFGGDVHQSFDYDDIGQLTSAAGYYDETSTHERRYTLAMEYDAIGNITNKTQSDVRSLLGGGSPSTISGTSHALTYSYLGGGSTRPHAATTVGSRTFTFDPNGNQLGWTDSETKSTRAMVWDEDDRLESVTTDGSTVEFLYDGAGERTHKWSSAGVSVYANAYWSVRNGVQTTKHIFASGQRIASIVNDPVTGTQEHWFHTDHLGSTQFVTDAVGAVREHHESLPFGEPWIEESSASDTTPFRFTGKELDSETGLQYFGARYYDPRQGQWASVDPALAEFGGRGFWMRQPMTSWVYSYSANSPLRLVDPDGRNWEARFRVGGDEFRARFFSGESAISRTGSSVEMDVTGRDTSALGIVQHVWSQAYVTYMDSAGQRHIVGVPSTTETTGSGDRSTTTSLGALPVVSSDGGSTVNQGQYGGTTIRGTVVENGAVQSRLGIRDTPHEGDESADRALAVVDALVPPGATNIQYVLNQHFTNYIVTNSTGQVHFKSQWLASSVAICYRHSRTGALQVSHWPMAGSPTSVQRIGTISEGSRGESQSMDARDLSVYQQTRSGPPALPVGWSGGSPKVE